MSLDGQTMRQSTRGDVQWSGGTSDPARTLSCNFVRSPSGPASALVRLVADCFAETLWCHSIRRGRVSGCPTWSESHCFRARVTMTTPSRAQVDFCVRRLRRPGHALRACMRALLSDCALSAGPTDGGCYFGKSSASQRSAALAGGGVLRPWQVSSSECGAVWRIG